MDAEGIARFEAEMDSMIAGARGAGRPEPKPDPAAAIAKGEPFLWCELTPVVVTPGILQSTTPVEVLGWMTRHFTGDFGDVCPEDRQANIDAIRNGERVLSLYHTKSGEKVYVITEWNRSLTTVLLASEY